MAPGQEPKSIYKPFPLFHISRDGNFDVVMNGTHRITGTVSTLGDTAAFTPLIVNGFTKAEMLASQTNNTEVGRRNYDAIQSFFTRLKGTFDKSHNYLTISIEDWRPARMMNEKPETLVLHAFAPKASIAKSTVSAAENPFVGTWRSYAGGPEVPNATPEEKKIQEDDNLKHGRFVLCLRSDNTFQCDMLGESKGKWALEGSNLVLFVEKDVTLYPAHKVNFTVLAEGKELSTPGIREDTAYFRKVEG